MPSDRNAWMWQEALGMLDRAERLRRDLYQPGPGGGRANWEPPCDVIETDDEVLVLVALPGVGPDAIEARIEGGFLHIAGQRTLPPEVRASVIHRLEIPQGRFARSIPLPPGAYSVAPPSVSQGCLVLHLRKL